MSGVSVRLWGWRPTGIFSRKTIRIPLAPACKDGPLPAAVREIFWEGACVVAAHQFLTLHGECGYVDADGRPNPDYDSADARIKALARIGAAVIERFYETCAA